MNPAEEAVAAILAEDWGINWPTLVEESKAGHDGDCTNQIHSCALCQVEQFREAARQIVGIVRDDDKDKRGLRTNQYLYSALSICNAIIFVLTGHWLLFVWALLGGWLAGAFLAERREK